MKIKKVRFVFVLKCNINNNIVSNRIIKLEKYTIMCSYIVQLHLGNHHKDSSKKLVVIAWKAACDILSHAYGLKSLQFLDGLASSGSFSSSKIRSNHELPCLSPDSVVCWWILLVIDSDAPWVVYKRFAA